MFHIMGLSLFESHISVCFLRSHGHSYTVISKSHTTKNLGVVDTRESSYVLLKMQTN